MSDDGFAIRKTGSPRRVDYASVPDAGELVSPPIRGPQRARAPEGVINTADVLPSELGGNVDLRLFERMNSILVSPAITSMTHRANVLHSVVSWLDAQSARIDGAVAPEGERDDQPWLKSIVQTLKEEISFIEAFHQGTLRDVESKVE